MSEKNLYNEFVELCDKMTSLLATHGLASDFKISVNPYAVSQISKSASEFARYTGSGVDSTLAVISKIRCANGDVEVIADRSLTDHVLGVSEMPEPVQKLPEIPKVHMPYDIVSELEKI